MRALLVLILVGAVAFAGYLLLQPEAGEPPEATAPAVAPDAPAAAEAKPPYPTGFSFRDLAARVQWRAKILAGVEPMDAATKASVERGRALFFKVYTPETGLGPYFNQRSCLGCHNQPGPLGRGTMSNAARPWGRGEKAAFGEEHPFAGTRLMPRHTLDGYPPYEMPEDFVAMGERAPTNLAGLGWIEAISAEQIFAQKHCKEPEPAPGEVCGWAPPKETGAGSLRFGIKLVTATIDEFVASAFANEMGITSVMPLKNKDDDKVPDLEVSAAEIIDVSNFIAFSEAPGKDPGPEHVEGLRLFTQVGCKGCHYGEFTVEGKKAPQMWSDLLAHDLGPEGAETRRDELTPKGHFRTAPLWGLSGYAGPFMRDGRAKTLPEAIAQHGGEGSTARDAFAALSEAEKQKLVALLKAL